MGETKHGPSFTRLLRTICSTSSVDVDHFFALSSFQSQDTQCASFFMHSDLSTATTIDLE